MSRVAREPVTDPAAHRDTGLSVGFAASYRRLVRMRAGLLVGFAVVTILSLLIDLSTGPSSLSLLRVIEGLVSPKALAVGERVILWDVRLPYAMMAVFVGASLGLAGAETQTVLNNPLASPFTLGISWAAILGATFAIVFDLSIFGVGQLITPPIHGGTRPP